MSKLRKPSTLEAHENREPGNADLLEPENRQNGDHNGQFHLEVKKKEIDGIWVAAFLLGMLLLLVFVHWLRTS